MKLKILLSLIILIGAGCSSGRKVLDQESNKITGGKTLSVWADWVKNKGDKYDISFHMQNESEKPIIVYLSDITCSKGNKMGMFKHTFFNTGERTMDFRPHERKQTNMVCDLGKGTKAEGAYKIEIRKVYSNKSGDGRSAGSPIVSNLVWTLKDSK